MTRKDYLMIAAALNSAHVRNIANSNKAIYNNGVDNAIVLLALALEKDNPAFDRNRFLQQAGVSPL